MFKLSNWMHKQPAVDNLWEEALAIYSKQEKSIKMSHSFGGSIVLIDGSSNNESDNEQKRQKKCAWCNVALCTETEQKDVPYYGCACLKLTCKICLHRYDVSTCRHPRYVAREPIEKCAWCVRHSKYVRNKTFLYNPCACGQLAYCLSCGKYHKPSKCNRFTPSFVEPTLTKTKTPSLTDCLICMSPIEESCLRRCSATSKLHAYCTDCLADAIRTKQWTLYSDAEKCLSAQCAGRVDIRNLPKISQEWYTKYEIQPIAANLKECALCHETLFMDNGTIKADDVFFDCPICHGLTCTSCEKAYHGNSMCQVDVSYANEFKQILQAAKINFTECPRCMKICEVEKDMCNKMLCRCGNSTITIFCAVCKKTHDTDHEAYSHFCRSFEDSPINCSRANCSHCFVWSSKRAQDRAPDVFLQSYPQFATS